MQLSEAGREVGARAVPCVRRSLLTWESELYRSVMPLLRARVAGEGVYVGGETVEGVGAW